MRNELVLSRQKRNNTETERESNQSHHSNHRSNQITFRTDEYDQRRTTSPKSPFNSLGSTYNSSSLYRPIFWVRIEPLGPGLTGFGPWISGSAGVLPIDEPSLRTSSNRLEYYNSPGSSHQTMRSPNHIQEMTSSNNSATESETGFQIMTISELDESLSPVDMSPSQECLLDSITNFWR